MKLLVRHFGRNDEKDIRTNTQIGIHLLESCEA